EVSCTIRNDEAVCDNDCEPDPPHGTPRWDGWQESNRGRRIAGACATNAGSCASADPPLPPILGDRPARLLHLQPAARRAGLVQPRFVLGNQTLEVTRDHLLPGLLPVRRQPPHREHQLTPECYASESPMFPSARDGTRRS